MRYFITIVILLTSLYLTAAGYIGAKALQQSASSNNSASPAGSIEYRGVVYRSLPEVFKAIEEQRNRRWFGLIFFVPESLVLVIGGIAAGLFGGALRVLMLMRKTNVGYAQVVFEPMVGLGLATILFLFSLAVPSVFTANSGPVRPETVLFLCACGGLFSEKTYDFIEAQVTKHFSK